MNLTLVLLVVIAATAVTGLAKRQDLQVPLVLVTFGSVASFIPGMPRLELEPDIILGVVLPPLLYSAALDFSLASLRRNIGPILRLGVGLVLVTAFVVGFFANWLVPELTLGAAMVLGAVVSPTDAVSAVSVGRQLGLPKRVLAILTGEGLLNDATALTLFTVGVAAVAGTRVVVEQPVLFFLYEVAGGVVIGFVLATVVRLVRARMSDSPLETVLGLVLPFAAYLAAEEIHASGVLAVVVAGFVMGHHATNASVPTRIQERSLWATLDLLLETFVFAYMGLQLKFVIDDVADEGLPVHHIFAYAIAVLVVVIAVRPLWVFVNWSGLRMRLDPRTETTAHRGLNWRQKLVVSWAGMRGVVTLAAAGGVPVLTAAGDPFPGRGVIQAIAFVVAVGTLVIQGATIPFLIERLDVADPAEAERDREQTLLARRISAAAADRTLAELSAHPPAGANPEEFARAVARVRLSVRARAQVEEAEGDDDGNSTALHRTGALFDTVRRRVLQAQRRALIAARDEGDLEDEVLRAELEARDIEEAAAEQRVLRRRRG
ncbi:Na+/H+ antiporter [Rhodococcus sp. SGAir0479]|uniref:Na+/H+ antiporter n=1 Tax=Rhodococcus sp. SGAir0479 TaxID=2567884 RepID=UPI0010CCF73D|nr:Na+/H+ antiporter [Rhodococcus sp. SGAir0479]QCQ89961.1 Na+/H+ antiporter [Rhodococcus sp. SGAir0479]